jgi:peptide/nickel transport system permease protein
VRSASYLLRRLGNTLVVILGVATATFFLARISGDPVDQLLPMEASQEARAALRAQLGLDAPLPVQYVRFLRDVASGEFGTSIRYREPALQMYWQRLPATVELVIAAVLLSVVLGVALGILAAIKHGTFIDTLVSWFALIGQAVPAFYLGLMMILLFSLQWSLLPTGGRGTWQQLIMPTIVLSGYYVALMARMTRAAFLDTVRLDFVRTARAKGLPESRVNLKHVLRAALIPIVTLIGLQIGGLFSGAVVTETVFTWPGIGRLAVDAIYARDFPVMQTVVIMSATIFVLVNLVVDMLYAVIDPRITYG